MIQELKLDPLKLHQYFRLLENLKELLSQLAPHLLRIFLYLFCFCFFLTLSLVCHP